MHEEQDRRWDARVVESATFDNTSDLGVTYNSGLSAGVHTVKITAMAFSTSQDFLATGSEKGRLMVIETG